MTEQQSGLKCEACGASGPLVTFGDPGGYRYHCLSCWMQVAEQVAVAYAEPPAGPAPGPGPPAGT